MLTWGDFETASILEVSLKAGSIYNNNQIEAPNITGKVAIMYQFVAQITNKTDIT